MLVFKTAVARRRIIIRELTIMGLDSAVDVGTDADGPMTLFGVMSVLPART